MRGEQVRCEKRFRKTRILPVLFTLLVGLAGCVGVDGEPLVLTVPDATATLMPTETRVPTETWTPLPTFSPTATNEPTVTWTPLPTLTPTSTPTFSPTATAVPTDTAVPTETPPPTDTPAPTETATVSPTDTSVATVPIATVPAATPVPAQAVPASGGPNDDQAMTTAATRDDTLVRGMTATPLLAALAYGPTEFFPATELSFTDWALLKEYAGMPDITSAASAEERDAFVQSLLDGQTTASMFASSSFMDHAVLWGWDSLDLVWEAMFTFDDLPPVFVLKLRDDFDIAPILAHFAERGFEEESDDGVSFFSHELDVEQDWQRAGELAILNTAVLDDENVLILSSNPDGVEAVYHATFTGESFAGVEPMHTVAEQLGEVATAILLPGSAICTRIEMQPLIEALFDSDFELEQALQAWLDRPRLFPYTTLGMGYRYETIPDEIGETRAPVWEVVMEYPRSTLAKRDLETRQLLAETGISLSTGLPYRELFAVVDASLADTRIVLRLLPQDRQAETVLRMFYQLDMLFAACGAG